MRATRAAGLVVAVVMVLAGAGVASAQYRLGGLNAEGEVEAGVRYFLEEPSSSRRAKFEEYRDIPEGLFLEGLRLRLFRPDESYSVELGGQEWGERDQEYRLGAGRLGLWEFGFEWNQIPHIYSTTGRTLANEVDPGVWRLPTPRPLLPAHNTGRHLDEIGQQWDVAHLFLTLTPTPDLGLKAEYTRIKKDGERPFSLAFGSPANNFYEVLYPIDQTIQDFRLGATLSRERWQLQFAYNFSMFQQSIRGILADNPCFGLAAAIAAGGCAGDGTAAAPAAGQMSVEPDNMAHTLTVSGGVNLPMRTRVSSALSYSMRLQNESFLPHTINPAFAGNPALALPDSSLDGMVGITLFTFNVSTRPVQPLTLSLRYRLFDRNDMTEELLFPGHVVNDRTLVTEPRTAGRYEYTRHNADLDARLRLLQPLALILGTGWERWDRNKHREVEHSDEYFAKAGFDAHPLDWLSASLVYRPSWRRIEGYETFAHLEHTVVEELAPSDFAQAQSPLLRKYDEAERDRHRLDLGINLTPGETLTAAISAGWRHDDYRESQLGLQSERSWSAGLDLGWVPVERVRLTAGYVYENINRTMRSRNRDVSGALVSDFPDFDWVSDITDKVHTVHLGAIVGLIPRTLDLTLGATYQYAYSDVDNTNPVTPQVHPPFTAATAANATVRRWPTTEDQLFRLDTALRYTFLKNWTAKLGYAWESFQKNDWRTDGLQPFVPGVTSIWLGNDLKSYSAHILALTLGYRF